MANKISCLKFEKTWANEHFERHNFRVLSPEYLLKNHAHENEYRTIFSPRSEYEKIDFSNKRGRKIEYAHSIREAVLLVKDGTTIKDIESAVKKIEDTLEIKCCSIAIHNDEGHVDKDSGQTIYNTHAHLVFYTLDKDGKQNFRLTKVRSKLSKLQQDLADELHMIKPKVNSKRKGLSHAGFREVQEQLEQEKNKQKDLDNKQIEKLTRDRAVLSNNLSDIATELEVPKDENNKFKLQDIKNKVKALNEDNKELKSQLEKKPKEIIKTVEKTVTVKRDLTDDEIENLPRVQILNRAVKRAEEELVNTNKELKSELMTLKAQKALVEEERKKYKEQGDHIASEYRALQALNKTLHTQEELDHALEKLRQEYKDRLALKDKTITELQTKNTELNDTVNNLKNENSKLKLELKTKPKEVIKIVEKTVKRELTDDEIEKLPRVTELNSAVNNLTNKNTELQQNRDYYKKLNTAVFQAIQAMHSDFDIEHPIPSLKKIYLNWKSRKQKPSITPQKSSETPLKHSQSDEMTIKRVEVPQTSQSQSMSVLDASEPEEKFYTLEIGRQTSEMTAKGIREWLEDYPEDKDIFYKQLSESDRREVFGEPKQTPSRVKHGFHR